MKPLKVDLPYPDFEDLTEDKTSAIVISPSYAGLHGELRSILQYVYHARYFEKNGLKEIADTLLSVAVCEMEHISILGKLLIKLGLNPVYTLSAFNLAGFFSTSSVSYSTTPEKMFLDDISGEINAINGYETQVSEG
ncbi:MAG: hypothetical protein MJ072_03880, partial [Clostridia bacterium]|nr:hypothetical protein [Clostridia bacterium]